MISVSCHQHHYRNRLYQWHAYSLTSSSSYFAHFYYKDNKLLLEITVNRMRILAGGGRCLEKRCMQWNDVDCKIIESLFKFYKMNADSSSHFQISRIYVFRKGIKSYPYKEWHVDSPPHHDLPAPSTLLSVQWDEILRHSELEARKNGTVTVAQELEYLVYTYSSCGILISHSRWDKSYNCISYPNNSYSTTQSHKSLRCSWQTRSKRKVSLVL